MSIASIISVIGIVVMMLGYGSAVYGFHQMYSFYQLSPAKQELIRAERRIAELLGFDVPIHDVAWIVIGAAVFAVGLVALILNYRKRCAEEKE